MHDSVFIILVSGALLIFWFSFLIIDSKTKQHGGHGHSGLEKFTKSLKLSYLSLRQNDNAETNSFIDATTKSYTEVMTQAKTQELNHATEIKPCKMKFPPLCKMDSSVIYWNEQPECYTSPARGSGSNEKYVVFEPDLGGWNNIRMGVETVIVFAHATGRTLVIPPEAVLYLLNKNKKNKDNKSGMKDFYNITLIGQDLAMVSMETFLRDVAGKGQLALPLPRNDTSLAQVVPKRRLWDYLNSACYSRSWVPGKYFMGLNISRRIGPGSQNTPVFGPVKASKRLKAMSLDRQLIVFDKEFHKQRAIFFSGQEPNRLLTHFYAFLHFADLSIDRFYKRFVRDRLRYHDSIYCTASEVIRLLRQEAYMTVKPAAGKKRKKGPSTRLPMADIAAAAESLPDLGSAEAAKYPPYFAFHVRRGDFQQKQTRLSAETIVKNTLPLLDLSVTNVLYISTDETNRSFFDPFRAVFPTVRFLYDYEDTVGLSDINQNHIGMVEQVICANAHTFIGTPLSTFTAYITRIRGYMNKTKGTYPHTYYIMPGYAKQFHKEPRLNRPIWIREFTDAFEDIDEAI